MEKLIYLFIQKMFFEVLKNSSHIRRWLAYDERKQRISGWNLQQVAGILEGRKTNVGIINYLPLYAACFEDEFSTTVHF